MQHRVIIGTVRKKRLYVGTKQEKDGYVAVLDSGDEVIIEQANPPSPFFQPLLAYNVGRKCRLEGGMDRSKLMVTKLNPLP